MALSRSWGLNIDQTITLLRWRCQLLRFDEDVDELGLRAGALDSCLRVLRFPFVALSA